jgi:hypothetical protein
MTSLLAQFYNKIKGSQEDIASEGLVYILKNSISARKSLKVFTFNTDVEFGNLNYSTQNTGEKLERPDISGYDREGKEMVIIESKFWAALTDNQPVEYLSRLGENSVLLFVCPDLRVRPIFDEIQRRISEENISFTPDANSHNLLLDGNKHILIKTWSQIIEVIRFALIEENNKALLSDLDQIEGFCKTIDSVSFLPFASEDFAPSNAKRINSYYDLLDKVTDELVKRQPANIIGLNRTPLRNGYRRYLRFPNIKKGIALDVRFDLWEKSAQTPFWILIKKDLALGQNWIQNEMLKSKIRAMSQQLHISTYETNNGDLYTPIFPLLNETEDVVMDNMTDKIVEYLSTISSIH